jgi:dTDP-D-glucose 4,6-dehydratase
MLHLLMLCFAESSVLRFAFSSRITCGSSITDPSFVKQMIGTMNLLNAAKATWQGNYEGKRFITSVLTRFMVA